MINDLHDVFVLIHDVVILAPNIYAVYVLIKKDGDNDKENNNNSKI